MTRGHADWFTPHRGSDLPIPSTELQTGFSVDTEAERQAIIFDPIVLDDSYNAFLRTVIVQMTSDDEPLLKRQSDAFVSVNDEDQVRFIRGLLVGGSEQTFDFGGAGYWFARMWTLREQKLTAGKELQVALLVGDIRIDTTFDVMINYILEVDA